LSRKRRSLSSASVDVPTTVIPSPANSESSWLNSTASVVQPGVKALGKK
jgi:hypothetical protein